MPPNIYLPDTNPARLATVWKPASGCIIPIAAFTVNINSGAVPFTVTFTDTTFIGTTPLTYSWDFGDGSALSTNQNPTHEYTVAGNYVVTLTVTNDCGSDTHTLNITASGVNINGFVAVSGGGVFGDGQHAMTSPDGNIWTLRPTITTYDGPYRAIAYSPPLNRFVAVALGNDFYLSNPGLSAQVITSDDFGATWTRRTAAETLLWWSDIIWVPNLNLFVAVSIGLNDFGGGGLNKVMTSPDGITWTSRVAAEDNEWRAITWSPTLNLFVAVANSGINRVMTSPDAITWTARAAAADNEWIAVCRSDPVGLFVAISTNGINQVMTSPDGITWTSRTAAGSSLWIDVIWCEELSLFVAVAATDAVQIMTSPDGINWTARTKPNDNLWSALAFNGTTIVCLAQSGSGNRVMTSVNGINWTLGASAGDKAWTAVAYSR